MSFYSDFAAYYESVFPFRIQVADFLGSFLTGPRQRVLDVGCGTGHYCGHFAAEGHQAVGIDLDPAMIAQAAHAYPAAEFHCLDMVDLQRLAAGSRKFDLAFCIGNVASHLPSQDLPDFLALMVSVLAPGGVWIIQVVNWDAIIPRGDHRFPDREVLPHPESPEPAGTGSAAAVFSREYQDVSEQNVRFLTRLATDRQTIFSGEAILYPVRARQYHEVHAAAGLRLEEHWGNYQRAPFIATEAGSLGEADRPPASPANIMVFRRE